ncbi:phosphate butyryltransferase [Microbacterium sp. APC 3898]|uniref:Phosphate butyryltransferase n=1 Tax=Planococcus notacanthi TaxID=3035188 RepID=A0ABT7ZIN8_9BACL|nr:MULTISPECIES: phosphate butyryltransferase [Terrabacteria group]MBF6633417.1 phosphate butyryltransferase [Planococcus sp. (in: firmicutes)]MDN3426778.1 phosphate butyryltransferase [Planococcus sp. APC 4016]MDN3500288.1 phosphate butyryltransferase [Microbacterium sp. APC 3898]
MATLTQLIENVPTDSNLTVAVAAAADSAVLEAVSMAVARNMVRFRLYDDESATTAMMREHFPQLLDHPDVQLHHVSSLEMAAEEAVKSVYRNDSDILMKGQIATAILLKAVLHPDYGLRTGRVMSQIAAFEVAGFDRLIFVTDAGMNINPDLPQKVQIIQNAVQIARSVGVVMPIVAPLAGVEVINPNMQATLDAAALTAMNRRGQIKNCIVDGPFALDNAISIDAAKHKRIAGDNAGKADILLVPTIESGNILYKSLVFFSNAKVGSIVAGAKAPIVLTSRADSAESKLYSLALAICSSLT